MKTATALAALLVLTLAGCNPGDGSPSAAQATTEPGDQSIASDATGDRSETSSPGDTITTEPIESESLPELSKSMSEFPDRLRGPDTDEYRSSICEPTDPQYAELIKEPVEVDGDVAAEVFPEDTEPRSITLTAFYVNSIEQVYSVYVSSDDDVSADEPFQNGICIESEPAPDAFELDDFPDEADTSAINDLYAELLDEHSGEPNAKADAEEAFEFLTSDDEDFGDDVRIVFIVPEFCDDLRDEPALQDQCAGNDELRERPVATHVIIDPSVGRGAVDKYSVKRSSSVHSTVKSTKDRHKVFIAIRKKRPPRTRVDHATVKYGYSKTVRANTGSSGAVWFSTKGARSNPGTAKYTVKGTWRTESYSK